MTCLDGSSVLHVATVVRGLHLLETCFTELQHGVDHVTDSRPTLIFADDNLKVTEVACALLNSAYEVVKVAADGEEAIRSILELEPDVAVLDISMPKMDGITVARQLRQANSSTLIVFLTLINDDDYVRVARSVGHGYVLKRRLFTDLLTALTSARIGSFFCSQ